MTASRFLKLSHGYFLSVLPIYCRCAGIFCHAYAHEKRRGNITRDNKGNNKSSAIHAQCRYRLSHARQKGEHTLRWRGTTHTAPLTTRERTRGGAPCSRRPDHRAPSARQRPPHHHPETLP